MNDEKKYCGRGDHWVSVSEFWRDRSRPDGLQNWCNQCRLEWDAEYKQTPAGRATQERYEKSKKRAASRKRRNKKRREEYRDAKNDG